tara:strand:+ start:903 stop:1055 length:153 start_codon:yes stop_codon:yes gene_type:complete
MISKSAIGLRAVIPKCDEIGMVSFLDYGSMTLRAGLAKISPGFAHAHHQK